MSAHLAFDDALPITSHVEQITNLVKNHQVVIVAGETGSGKTTQLPKICLLAGRQRIGHTQPRRLAARSVAERIAQEMRVPLGELVGYQVRFTKSAGRQTQIKLMTDGIMLAEITADRDLRRYDTIIIDEAHERSLNIDFLLGYLKQLVSRRPELRVIITSATIDTARFAAHFGDAPVVEVSGRSYPVQVRYRPPAEGESDSGEALVKAAEELISLGGGDILVFCPGERDIRDAIAALEAAEIDADLLALHARLSASEQNRIFAAHQRRRIIVATNIAETSLTVPGIRYVIDTGLARVSRYSARTKVQRLPIEPISKASADQRAGRCGRVAPGVAIRLYSEADFEDRSAFTEPEILRTNLAAVILAMAKARLGQITDFPFVDAPDSAQITDGLRLLRELGAIKQASSRDAPLRLTPIGAQLANLPIDPRLGRMLIEAARRGCLREAQIVVSFLAIQDIRERPADNLEQADAAHARFFSDAIFQPGQVSSGAAPPAVEASAARQISAAPLRHTAHTSKTARYQAMRDRSQPKNQGGGSSAPTTGGDIAAILRIWRYLRDQHKAMSGNQFRKLCQAEYLNYLRFREWQDLHAQLKQICKELDLPRNSTPAPFDALATAILSGLLSHIGLRLPKSETRGRGRRAITEYQGPRGARFAIQPGSACAKNPPELVMAVELVETSRLWARTVTAVEPEWVEAVGGHLIKRSHGDPYWSSAQAAVLTTERVSLLGVPLVADRRVQFARVNPRLAREIFIRAGLVEGQWQPRDEDAGRSFLAHNRQVIDELAEIADRTRGQGFIVDDDDIFTFYDRRLPEQVNSGASFERWWQTQPDKHYLDVSVDLLANSSEISRARSDFPDTWGELGLPVSYIFSPGHSRDGVSVRITMAQLNQVRPEPFSWQVPGLREELAIELIRSLPKSVRTRFVPAPDHARAALRWLAGHEPNHDLPFCQELGRALTAITGETIEAADWHPEAVPSHLRIGFEITGSVTHYGNDLAGLQRELSSEVSATITKAAPASARSGSWTFGSIPQTQEIKDGLLTAIGYPALADQGDAVSLVMASSPLARDMSHRKGIRRLLVLVNPDPTKWVIAQLSNSEKLALPASCYASVPELLADARLKAVDSCAWRLGDPAAIRDSQAFSRLAMQVRQGQADAMRQIVGVAAKVVDLARQVRQLAAQVDIGDQLRFDLDNLIFPGYLSFTRDPWLERLPAYLSAMIARGESASRDPNRDARLNAPIDELVAEFDELCALLPAGSLPDAVDDIGFWIEELRVQTFNQRLGTVVPVSAKRIRRALAEADSEFGR